MEEQKIKEIVITDNISFTFPKIDASKGDMLIIGNFNGICGEFNWDKKGMGNFFDGNFINENVFTIAETLKNGHRIVLASSKETIEYFQKVMYCLMDMGTFGEYLTDKQKKRIFNRVWPIDTTDIYTYTYKKYNATTSKRRESATDNIDKVVLNKIYKRIEKMKFDVVIQNPPYNGSLHLDFFNKGLDVLTETGKMVIIEPATWLINVRKNGRAKTYDAIKERINGHIESVVIENLNAEFGVAVNAPFAITTIDMSKTFDTIDYTCFGELRKVKSVYDCNLVGEYNVIWSILEKVQSFDNMMKAHITNNSIDGNNYIQYNEILTTILCWHNTDYLTAYAWDSLYETTANGDYFNQFTKVGMNMNVETPISNVIPKRRLAGGGKSKIIRYSDKNADCIYGTQTELENWKHFIFNNKLPLFLNIVLTIDQNNNSKEFLPWLVDKQYTDDEINKLFGFTDEEIKLIDTTIKKYERNSPWFKRYMCGKDAVTDEEVNNFIAEISK